MRLLLLFFSIMYCSSAEAQSKDTVSVVCYNLLNFPSTNPARIDTLEVIAQHLQPDLFLVCELTSIGGGNNILSNAMNTGPIPYAVATLNDGPGTDNALYYNTDKFEADLTWIIPTTLRDITGYRLWHKANDLATTTDTVFFYVFICHLKAGTGFAAQRDSEAQTLKDYIATNLPDAENIIIGGDFNLYGSSIEPAWNTILTGGGITMKDPIVSPGEWNSNSSYAPIHTQSTRTTSFDGGATGGMDSRFDLLFVGQDLMDYSNDARYITGSYRIVGQDALHFNDALIDPPTNTSEPWNVITALYYMSDHLPVYMEIEVVAEYAGIEEVDLNDYYYYHSESRKLIARNPSELTLFGKVINLQGQLVNLVSFIDGEAEIGDLESGVYVLEFFGRSQMKFVVE